MDHFLKLLPTLGHTLRKGDCGKIAVIGGSIEYTGAPYFSACSISRLGADLIHVFCAEQAANVIKTYSPDLIVHPGLSPEIVIPKLSRIDAIVIGPGLGRDLSLIPLIDSIFNFTHQKQIPLVIDGDALWFISEQHVNLPENIKCTILTPNFTEFSRLCKSILDENDVSTRRNQHELQNLAIDLSAKMSVSIYLKGEVDLVVTPNGEVSKCSTEASLRRCGGQGDVSAGCLALLLFWARREDDRDWITCFHEAGIASSWLVRTAGRRAFEKLGRSMNTPALLDEIPKLIRDVECREPQDTFHSS